MSRRAASSESTEAGTEVAVRPGPRAARGERLGLRERGRLRRRVRFLRKRRELELRDLGGLIFDMYRFGSKRQDLVREKLREMFAADRELREFEPLLGRRARHLDVREAGVGGACANCGELYSTDAHFCSRCGLAVSASAQPDAVVEPEPVVEHAAVQEPAVDPATQTWQAEPQTEAWVTEPETAPAQESAPEPAPVAAEPEPVDGDSPAPTAPPAQPGPDTHLQSGDPLASRSADAQP